LVGSLSWRLGSLSGSQEVKVLLKNNTGKIDFSEIKWGTFKKRCWN